MPKSRITPPDLSQQQIQRFHSQVDQSPGLGPNGDCFHWKGQKDKDSYGKFAARKPGDRRYFRAHRIALFLARNIWSDEDTLHSCDNPPCVNPKHLSAGTTQQNTQQAKERGLIKRGIENPNCKLTEEQVREIRLLKGRIGATAAARKYNVTTGPIYGIWNNKIWQYLNP